MILNQNMLDVPAFLITQTSSTILYRKPFLSYLAIKLATDIAIETNTNSLIRTDSFIFLEMYSKST